MSEDRIDVLFVCTHNAGRSVAAKTIFNDRAVKLGLDLRAQSAGTKPGDRVNPAIQRVLESFNLDRVARSSEVDDRRNVARRSENRDHGMRSGRRMLPCGELRRCRRLGIARPVSDVIGRGDRTADPRHRPESEHVDSGNDERPLS